ncbi:MAG: adenylate kinase [Saprospiraceae bacterium]
MKHIILFGPPGSGKGTQAQKLIEKYRLYHISTGDLFRAEIAASSPLGLQAQDFMNKGILVPDEVTLGMLRNKLNSLKDVNGIIYDGFPRTIAQAEALDHMLNENNECINALISLEVTDDEIVHRIMLRGQTSGRADDLDESIIRKRMDEYRSKTSSVFNYYKQMNVTHQVKGIGTVEEIFDNLCTVMDRLA